MHDGAQLLVHLMTAAERYAVSNTGNSHSHTLWNSPFMVAIAMLVSQISSLENPHEPRGFSISPVIYLILMQLPSDMGQFSQRRLADFIWDVLHSKTIQITSGSSPGTAIADVSHFFHQEIEAYWRWREAFKHGIPRVLARGLDEDRFIGVLSKEDLINRGLTARATAAWIINGLVNDFEVPYLECVLDGFTRVLNDFNAALSGPGDTTGRFIRADVALRWLKFIWVEISNALINSTGTDVLLSPEGPQCAQLIIDQLCINPIQILVQLDQNYNIRRQTVPYIPENIEDSPSFGDPTVVLVHPTGKRCTFLSGYRPEILRCIEVVRRHNHGISFNSRGWKNLEDILCNAKTQDYEETNTTVGYRDNEVRREILEALKSVVQSAQSSGMFDHLSSHCLTFVDILCNHYQGPVAFHHLHKRKTHQQ